MKSQSIAKVLVGISLLQVLAGCAPSKTAQCNTLSGTVNKGVELGKKLETFGNGLGDKLNSAKTPEDFQAAAKEISSDIDGLVGEVEQFGKSIAAVELEDTALVGFRNRAAANYNLSATTLKQMGDTFKKVSTAEIGPNNLDVLKEGAESLQSSATKMQEIDAEEKKISSEFNTYCGAK